MIKLHLNSALMRNLCVNSNLKSKEPCSSEEAGEMVEILTDL